MGFDSQTFSSYWHDSYPNLSCYSVRYSPLLRLKYFCDLKGWIPLHEDFRPNSPLVRWHPPTRCSIYHKLDPFALVESSQFWDPSSVNKTLIPWKTLAFSSNSFTGSIHFSRLRFLPPTSSQGKYGFVIIMHMSLFRPISRSVMLSPRTSLE